MAINTYFKNIADTIREKTGGSALITPGQMPQAIRDIISGGGGLITPEFTDMNGGYVDASGNWIVYGGAIKNDVYHVEDTSKNYLLTYNNNQPERFRLGCFANNVWSSNKQGVLPTIINSSGNGLILTIQVPSSHPYLCIYKGTTAGSTTILVTM